MGNFSTVQVEIFYILSPLKVIKAWATVQKR